MLSHFFSSQAEQASDDKAEGIDIQDLIRNLSNGLNADFFIYNGPIDADNAQKFIEEIDQYRTNESVVVIICTLGGDADAAYIIARFLKSQYTKFILYVFGLCKSAGTLLALGADEIVMSHRGELGPLDVQLLKTDELLFRGSGLDIAQALDFLSDQGYNIFEKTFLTIIQRSQGAISTKTAADIASSLAVGIISPITGQIDPLRVGEVERAMQVAFHYGIRLNNNPQLVDTLVRNYQSHGFVIDCKEAQELFKNVREPNEVESLLEQTLRRVEIEINDGFLISEPNPRNLVMSYLGSPQENDDEQQAPNTNNQQETNGESASDTAYPPKSKTQKTANPAQKKGRVSAASEDDAD